MKYEIIGKTVPAVEVTLNKGESMFTQGGGMTWRTDAVEMKTNTHGGIMKGLGRMLAGDSIFMNTFTASKDDQKVAFATTNPGAIVSIDLGDMPDGIVAQKGAFLCAEENVKLDIMFTKKISAGLFGGEGFILQNIHGTGMAFLEIDGDKVEKTLLPGEVIKVDTGNVVAFEKSVKYEVETIKGMSNIFLGGEGLFITRLTGPGKVILQTQNFNDFSGRILARMPKT
jgi:uncharacterized protein (TIGR00266 family)